MIQASGVGILSGQGQAGGELANNRTGATSVIGGTGAIDTNVTPQAESTNISTSLSNIIAVLTAQMAVGLIGVWDRAGIADNTAGRFIMGEDVVCTVNVDGTTDVAIGDALKCVTTGDHMVKATPGTDRYHAIALEARTANSEGPVRAILFSSGRF